MNKPSVRYYYALDENNRLISIKDTSEKNKTFVCPHCKSEMIKKCGQHNAWHFAHKNKQCDYDKYLHTVAEQRIMEWFNESEKVIIKTHHFSKCPSYDQCKWRKWKEFLCSKRDLELNHNIKQWYGHAELEKAFVKDGKKFVADIFCHNLKDENNPLFIEINVTHPCEQNKIDSGIKIIEFDIHSEEDIEAIINSPIQESEKTRYHHFHPKETKGQRCDVGLSMQKFVLMPSMKAFIDQLLCHDIEKRRGVFELTIENDDSIPYFLQYGGFYAVAMAVANDHFKFNSCTFCKYQAYNEWESSFICTLYKKYGTHKYCNDNNPAECSFFRKNETVIKQRIEAFNEYVKNKPVDIWIKD